MIPHLLLVGKPPISTDTSIFNALSIGSSHVAVVLLCMKRDAFYWGKRDTSKAQEETFLNQL